MFNKKIWVTRECVCGSGLPIYIYIYVYVDIPMLVHVFVLLMKEILHKSELIGSFPTYYKVLYIPGDVGFIPSTVCVYICIYIYIRI